MAVTTDILRSWRAPRQVFRQHLRGPVREERALIFVMLACLLVFVGQWPAAARRAALDPDGAPLDAQIGAALMGWLFIAPLVFYGLAALSRLVAALLGGAGTWYTARMALFWSLLAVSPVWLLHGLVAGLIGPGPAMTLVGFVLLAGFALQWGAALWESEASPRPATEMDDS
jgi:hypothetical protein